MVKKPFIFELCTLIPLCGNCQMVSEKQRKESAPPVVAPENGTEKTMYYLAEVSLANLGNLKNMFARSLVLHNSITLETKENIKRRTEEKKIMV